MENLQALRRADEVRTFPSIEMPAAVRTASEMGSVGGIFKVHTGKGTFSRTKDLLVEVRL